MHGITEHGTPDFYLAVATVIPLLFLAYFFQARRDKAVGFWATLDYHAGPWIVAVGFLVGEIFSLLALYSYGDLWNAALSVVGASLVAAAGLIHLAAVALQRKPAPKVPQSDAPANG